MIDTLDNLAECTHMPFRVADVLLFCHPEGKTPTGAKRWKLYYLDADGKVHRFNTRLNEEAVECSPSAWCDRKGWNVSFVAGGVPSDPLFHLYTMHGICLDRLTLPRAIRPARTGFVFRDRMAWGKPVERVHVEESGERTALAIANSQIYRVSYRTDATDKLLVTAFLPGDNRFVTIEYDLNTGIQYEIECDGEPAYKASIFKDEVWYAYRGDNGFEDRQVRKATRVDRIPTQLIERMGGGLGNDEQSRNGGGHAVGNADELRNEDRTRSGEQAVADPNCEPPGADGCGVHGDA
jgi:hypothetical protein